MKKRTARDILRAEKMALKAHAILNNELIKLEDTGEISNVSDDILWSLNHLDQAISDGLQHHFEDALQVVKSKS